MTTDSPGASPQGRKVRRSVVLEGLPPSGPVTTDGLRAAAEVALRGLAEIVETRPEGDFGLWVEFEYREPLKPSELSDRFRECGLKHEVAR